MSTDPAARTLAKTVMENIYVTSAGRIPVPQRRNHAIIRALFQYAGALTALCGVLYFGARMTA